MVFPVVYSEIHLPKIPFKSLSILHFIWNKLLAFLHLLGLSDFLNVLITLPNLQTTDPIFEPALSTHPCPVSASAKLIKEMLPAVVYSDIVKDRSCVIDEVPESCAVCLMEFKESEEIRPLRNCRHVFHKSCLDPWIDLDQKTCPLCRTHFVPHDLREEFNRRLWSSSWCC